MLTALLSEKIAQYGPISFREFQETALYHPQYGYYRRQRDPFGIGGDFYTAEQLQPVFGLLIARVVGQLATRLGLSAGQLPVIELGAGRQEMRPHFEQWNYQAVESGCGELPQNLRGIVFANEFLDALPVHLVRRQQHSFVEVHVGCNNGTFHFVDGPAVHGDLAKYLTKHASHVKEGVLMEAHLDAIAWLDRLDAALEQGFLLFIDYGFTEAERIRFPQGTLMSYFRHQADEQVLHKPGDRDITAHVPFTMIINEAKERGFQLESFETLSQMLLTAGERDQFAAVLTGATEMECQQRRGQLKTLLFGMGETFRVLLFSRGVNRV